LLTFILLSPEVKRPYAFPLTLVRDTSPAHLTFLDPVNLVNFETHRS